MMRDVGTSVSARHPNVATYPLAKHYSLWRNRRKRAVTSGWRALMDVLTSLVIHLRNSPVSKPPVRHSLTGSDLFWTRVWCIPEFGAENESALSRIFSFFRQFWGFEGDFKTRAKPRYAPNSGWNAFRLEPSNVMNYIGLGRSQPYSRGEFQEKLWERFRGNSGIFPEFPPESPAVLGVCPLI